MIKFLYFVMVSSTVDKDEKKLEKSNLQRAKTSVINMLANYAKICQAKQAC